jgi:hypothetical protein
MNPRRILAESSPNVRSYGCLKIIEACAALLPDIADMIRSRERFPMAKFLVTGVLGDRYAGG